MACNDDAATQTELPCEEQVVAYLRGHPDFLLRHPDVALRLFAPARDQGNNVADLQQFMIERLKGKLDEMRGCAEHLITTTRSNMSTQAHTHEAVLAVLAARDMAELVQVLTDTAERLEVDVAVLCFETAAEVIPALSTAGVQRLAGGDVDVLLGEGQDVALRAATPGTAAVFGSGAGLVHSQALVRLPGEGRCPPGLLALGVREAHAFHPGQGTELLLFLAQVVRYAVLRWVR